MGPEKRPKYSWSRQVWGLLIGAAVGVVLTLLFPVLREFTYGYGFVFWCAIAGGVIASLDRFEKAGAVITRGTDRRLNYAVGLGFPVLFFLLLSLILRLLGSFTDF
jgi:hypothetical protein